MHFTCKYNNKLGNVCNGYMSKFTGANSNHTKQQHHRK